MLEVDNLLEQIKRKYFQFSAPVKAALWFTVCNVLQKGISLFTTPIFTRLLTTEEYGTYSVYQSWYSMITILATLNLSSGVYNNAMTKFPEERKIVTSSFQGLTTIITGILFVIYLLGINFWTDIIGLQPLFIFAMFIEMLFISGYSFWTVGERYDYSYRKIIVVTIIIAVGSPLLSILSVLSTTYRVEARILSHVFVQVIIGLFFYIYNARQGKQFFNKKYWRFALRFNIPLLPHYLSMTVLNQADRIMISKMVGASEAAIYSVAYTISTMMSLIINAVNSSFVPYTYKSMKAEKYDGLRKNTNVLLVCIAILCLLTMCFGPEIIAIFATEDYYDAIWIIPPVAASVYFMFLYPLFSNIEFYYEKTKFVMFISSGGAIANVILNYIFIKKFGYYAAGYTTLFCYIIFAFSHYLYQKWIIRNARIQRDEIYDSKFMMLISILVILVMFGMAALYKYIVLRYAIIVLILIVMVINRQKIISALKEYTIIKKSN